MESLSLVPNLKKIIEKFNNLEAIIFDMDGTLINSEVVHAKALQDLLIQKNLDINADKLLNDFKGVSEPDILNSLITQKIIEENTTLVEFVEIKNSYFEKYLNNEKFRDKIIFSEIIDLLKAAKKEKIKLALVTASERSTTDLFLSKLTLNHYFDLILTRDDTEKTKPDPMPYLHSFKKLQVEAINSLIFEDSDTGYTAAIQSGAQVSRVSWYD